MVWNSSVNFGYKLAAVTFSGGYETNQWSPVCHPSGHRTLVLVRSREEGLSQRRGLRAKFSKKEPVILLWCCLSKTPGKVRKTHLQGSPRNGNSDDKKNICPIKILSCKLVTFSLICYFLQELAACLRWSRIYISRVTPGRRWPGRKFFLKIITTTSCSNRGKG